MDEIIQGYPAVNLSITNPNVKRENALDRNVAFTFLEFIKNVPEFYEPEGLQNYYNEYIRRYNRLSTSKSVDNKQIIIERYREFLRDITLNYSTNAEKKFLSQIDFNDKYDLQVAISFYSKKIRSIISYYQVKRDKLQFSTTRAKLKGSNFGVKQNAYELIVDFLANRDTAALEYNIDDIKTNLSVSLTEYVDQYTKYFNIEPDEKEYGRNYLEYSPDGLPESNIFLTNDSVLVEEVFADANIFLREIKEVEEVFDNKRKQTEKFIGTDYYYLSTNSVGKTEYGQLFEAEAPYANFLNTDYPSVASVFSNDIKSVRDQGFFKPTNSSIVTIESERLEFFGREFYPVETLYIFPDPNLFSNDDEIFTFVIDTSRSINNQSKGIAVNQPNTDKNSTSMMGYSSEIPIDRDINTDLSFLFDDGYIYDSKKDLNGNIFGLLKDNNFYRNNFKEEPNRVVKNLILNGYQFFDTLYGEGSAFNYSTVNSGSTATYADTYRSGITSFTQFFTAGSDAETTSAKDIFFRYYGPNQSLIQPPNFSQVDIEQLGTIEANVKEGAFFKFSDNEILDDAVSTNLSSYTTSTGDFYFTDLIEAGIADFNNGSTVVRALCDSTHPAASGDFTYNVVASGDNGVTNMEGGLFTDDLTFDYNARGFESIDYNDETLRKTVVNNVLSATESFFTKQENFGKIYIKNINKPNSLPNVKELTVALPYLDTKFVGGGEYETTIKNELSGKVKEFDMFYNTMFIETSSFLIIENIEYDIKTNDFTNSNNTIVNLLSCNTNNFDKVSNRFKVGDDVFYAQLVKEGAINDDSAFKDIRIYPRIFKYSYTKRTTEQIYPTLGNPVLNDYPYFNEYINEVLLLESGKPQLTYSSENELFNLSFILKDQNKTPRLYSYVFEYTDKIKFIKANYYEANNMSYTYNFVKPIAWGQPIKDLSFINFALSSGDPTLSISYSPSAGSLIL
tara:strand:- start:1470 stop:4346 length:2877 start_codon:yes stop_codon:yes gene_type:complete